MAQIIFARFCTHYKAYNFFKPFNYCIGLRLVFKWFTLQNETYILSPHSTRAYMFRLFVVVVVVVVVVTAFCKFGLLAILDC